MTVAFIRKYPVIIYYILVFTISWGGFLLIGGSGLLAGTDWQTDPSFLNAVTALLAGPPAAGLLLTTVISGKDGLHKLFSLLIKWKVGLRWYAVSVLLAPLIQAAVLLALALFSPDFLPDIYTADNKLSLLLSGLGMGLIGGFVEEVGWTGFAVPRLRRRWSVFMTGIVVGVLWGIWHLPQMLWVGVTSAASIPLPLFLLQYFFLAIASLTAYRLLIMWVYDRTGGSLLLAVLMHGSYIFSTLFAFAPPTTGWSYLIYSWIFTAVLWTAVAAVFLPLSK